MVGKHQLSREHLYIRINVYLVLVLVMYTQKVIVLDSKSYSVVKIRHSRCLHTIAEEKEGLANFLLIFFTCPRKST